MMNPPHGAGRLGSKLLEGGFASFSARFPDGQKITSMAGRCAMSALNNVREAAGRLGAAAALENVIATQCDCCRTACKHFITAVTTPGCMCAEIARDAYRPFKTIVGRSDAPAVSSMEFTQRHYGYADLFGRTRAITIALWAALGVPTIL